MKKHYNAILFDLDGTLLPMDMDEFTSGYFRYLAVKLAPLGISHEDLVPAVWKGTGAMVKNDGSATNREVFWKTFEALTGYSEAVAGDLCLDFYGNEFHQAKQFTGENKRAKEAVEIARQKAQKVILATNPLFPMCGQKTRLSWIGLKPEDFDAVTAYEESRYCKPNPDYFKAVLKENGLQPEECLMIGNDEREDMLAGTIAGMDCYLVTDTMIACEEHPWTGDKGTFEDLIQALKELD